MKIGILTFHYANNYGALLQCYALSKVLKDLGHEVQLINLPPTNAKLPLKERIRFYVYYKMMDKFRKRHLPQQTPKHKSIESFVNDYPKLDCYIVGSDQVWNPQITKSNIDLYFFSFLPDSARRIAYAASFGLSSWEFPEKIEAVKDNLEKFSAIGVREKDAVSLCSDIFGVSAQQVLDPTLLLTNYSELFTKLPETAKKVVSYKFARDEKWFDVFRYVGKELGYEAVLLNENKRHSGIKSIPFTSLGTWLATLQNASFIITDSFHCMVFAIIFGKPFIALPAHPQRVGRMHSLLQELGLSNRFYSSYDEFYNSQEWKKPINYTEVHSRIESLRNKSLKFLKESIAKPYLEETSH